MIMSLKWVLDGKVEVGCFCTAQGEIPHLGPWLTLTLSGLIKMFGATGVALSTLVSPLAPSGSHFTLNWS